MTNSNIANLTGEQIVKKKALYWIVGDDTGISSKTIWAVNMEVLPARAGTPSDLDDFGRCKRLLDLIPEWRDRLDLIVNKYPNWKPIVDNWDKIEKEFLKEKPISYLIDEIISRLTDKK